ncbi:MAG: hypothetical protein GEU28_02855 [Dehalococcoidia bacterium]|nr:hypothetical protein [Dehalococcoidia bacterium]
MTVQELDSPLKVLYERIAPFTGPDPEMDSIASALADLGMDDEYGSYVLSQVEPGSLKQVHVPEQGPALLVVYSGPGRIPPIHSHRTWAALAPITGVETHRQYELVDHTHERATLRKIDERRVTKGQTVTITPPRDIHDHGHIEGTGDPACFFVLTGINQLIHPREQYVYPEGPYRIIEPGRFYAPKE